MKREYLARVWALLRTLEENRAVLGGVLSGTSGDGIDVVLARAEVERAPANPRVEGPARLVALHPLAFEVLPFPETVVGRVREVLDGAPLVARDLARLSRDLGFAFGGAANRLAQEHGLTLDLVGSHGLTVYHHDGKSDERGASMQIGDGDHVAESAGCSVVSDFRQSDLAAGGEGAPISILADDLLFRNAARPTTILNLGGLANLSWLSDSAEPLAFDTGPAGCLLDGLARRLLDKPYDEGGQAALRGRAQAHLLERWLAHPFFARRGPRSTGRDTFGEAWLEHLLSEANSAHAGASGCPPDDLMATAVELIAVAVARGVAELPSPGQNLWLAGGGAHNRALVQALGRHTRLSVASTSALGIDPDAREALVFAVLAGRCVLGEGVTRTSATGALPGRVLGKISPRPR